MTICDWNLELAHVNWGSPEAVDSVEEAVAQGTEQLLAWEAKKLSYVVCLLIDDKEMRTGDRDLWVRSTAEEFPKLFQMVDYIFFESSLITLKGEFLRLLEENSRPRIDREIERYRRKHGRVGCSHDIAIWHTLRLGELPSGKALAYPIKGSIKKPFFAGNCMSILEEEDKPAEERAMEILKRCTDRSIRDRVIVEYYA